MLKKFTGNTTEDQKPTYDGYDRKNNEMVNKIRAFVRKSRYLQDPKEENIHKSIAGKQSYQTKS